MRSIANICRTAALTVGIALPAFMAAAQVPAPAPAAPIPEQAPPPLPQQQQPPPLPAPQITTFFYERNGQPTGPVSLEQIGEEVRRGTITQQTLVWKSGAANWVAAKDLQELQPLLAALPPPVPAEAKWKQYILGSWQIVTNPMEGMTQTTTIQFRGDGSFGGVAKYVSTQFTNIPPITQAISGTWTVQDLGNNQFSLTLNTKGQPPSTASYRLLDQNTLEDDSNGAQARRIGG